MTAVARMAVLDLRTVAPYRIQGFAIFGFVAVVFYNRPDVLVPAVALLFASTMAAYPFNVGDKARMGTLYDLLPLPRRAVVLGHYVWALATYLVTVCIGTALAELFAHLRGVPFGTHVLDAVLTVSWALFALNVSLQFPLFIAFGYTRVSAMATTAPLSFITLGIARLHPTLAEVQPWLPLVWVGGAAAIAASAAVSLVLDARRIRGRIRNRAFRIAA